LPIKDLVEIGIIGNRLKCAKLLRSRIYNYTMITLITLYSLVIFTYFALGDLLFANTESSNRPLLLLEIGFLALFVLDISLHFYAFRCLYVTGDYWNFVDISLILATLGLVIVDVIDKDENISKLTRLRGLFRILRIVLLIRKVGALGRIQELDRLYEAQTKQTEDETYELRSPLERVLLIIRQLKSRVD